MWQEMTSRDLRWAEVTQKWRHLTGSHLEVAVKGWKLAYNVHFTFYKDVARSKSHMTGKDVMWTQATGSDIWPEVT